KVPGGLLQSPPVIDGTIVTSDQRNLSIWLVPGTGLARHEIAAVTSDAAPTGEPSFDDAQRFVFAPQVQDVLFEYFDGGAWQPTWDGTQLGGADGNTPIGPPAAIRITITIRGSSRAGATAANTRKFTHV